MAVGGAAQAGGSIMGGAALSGDYNMQANEVSLEARQKAMAIRRLAKETRSAADAGYAAAGVDVGSGSPRVAAQFISHNAEVDALNAIASGDNTAASLRKSGRAAKNAGFMNAAVSAIGTYAAYAALA